jgi:hypothetical protein
MGGMASFNLRPTRIPSGFEDTPSVIRGAHLLVESALWVMTNRKRDEEQNFGD